LSLGWLLLAVALVTSCTSTQPDKPFASVTISGQSAAAIRDAVDSVFTAEGYVESTTARGWAYDRRGSQMSQFVHGGWFYGEDVVERAKLELRPQPDGSQRLDCTAVIVRDAGDEFFQDESRMTRLKSSPYQKLLKKVARRFQ